MNEFTDAVRRVLIGEGPDEVEVARVTISFNPAVISEELAVFLTDDASNILANAIAIDLNKAEEQPQ